MHHLPRVASSSSFSPDLMEDVTSFRKKGSLEEHITSKMLKIPRATPPWRQSRGLREGMEKDLEISPPSSLPPPPPHPALTQKTLLIQTGFKVLFSLVQTNIKSLVFLFKRGEGRKGGEEIR